jgi:hypothetical protein
MNSKPEVGVLRKAYDISPGDDFYSRFLMGHGNIRTCVYDREKQLEYDNSFHPVFQNLVEMKIIKDKCTNLISKHIEAVQKGTEGKFHGHQIDINEPIDDELNIFFKDFFIRGQMAVGALIKHSLYMGSNIGFLFQEDEKKFRRGLKGFVLKEDDERFKALNSFIKNHKDVWYSSFRDLRRRIEHDGWSLPPLKYSLDSSIKVEVHIPAFPDKTIPEMLEIFWQNMISFCEDVVVFLLSLKLKNNMIIVYLPEDKRDPQMPVRYIVSLKEFPGVPLQCG